MTYLLDINVISAATANHSNASVLRWVEAHSDNCGFYRVSLREIWKGIHILPEGKRKQALSRWAIEIEDHFQNRIFDLDVEVLKVWGNLYATQVAKGFNMGILDSLLAASALVQDLTIATRNTSDFPSEVKTVNPWDT